MPDKVLSARENDNVEPTKELDESSATWQMDVAEFNNAGCLVNGN